MRRLLALPVAVLLVVPAAAFGHGGGLDANGCHTNRKTGEYHCHRPAGASAQPSAPAPRATRLPGGGVYYPNCAAARAAGVAPLRRGEPGYRPGLDRDGDGRACE